jgi:hypothetical protein
VEVIDNHYDTLKEAQEADMIEEIKENGVNLYNIHEPSICDYKPVKEEEDNEIEELTMEEVCKQLGKTIKIKK